MSKNKPIATRITEDHFNLLMEFGSVTVGFEAIMDSYQTMLEVARALIKKQKFTKQDIMVLMDPLSIRVNLSLSDALLDILSEKHGAQRDELRKKLDSLGQLEMIFLSDEIRKFEQEKLIEMYCD